MGDKAAHDPNRRPNGQFVAGNRANPNGRPPKDLSLTSLAKRKIDTLVRGDPQGRTWREKLVDEWFERAARGNDRLFRELIERIDGRTTQPIEHSGAVGVIHYTADDLAKARMEAQTDRNQG